MILKEGQCPGLTAEVIQALRTQNIRTVVDLVTADAEELSCKCSLSYKTLVAINRVLLAQYASFPINGADLYDELLSSTAILSTGNESLDKLLDSGLYTGEVTELIGSPGSGKTQVCLGVAANVACELKRNVVYIDSTGGLSASRLLEIVKSKVSTAEQQLDALRRIYVTEVFDIFSMLKVLQTLRTGGFPESPSGSSSLKAVIVDSVRAVLLPVIGGNQIEGM
uniref:RAD51 paralog D n=1 Tax=Erpetoichthys calabaricus TaxID=27687 RepID=A0A8C4S116_ERPCA